MEHVLARFGPHTEDQVDSRATTNSDVMCPLLCELSPLWGMWFKNASSKRFSPASFTSPSKDEDFRELPLS